METPRNRANLSKRIRRFLARETARDKVLADLLKVLHDKLKLNLYLFGGAIRDIALYGNREDPTDIDIVYAGNSNDDLIEKVLDNRFSFEKNKFGGYRIPTAYWTVDFWCAQNTWAIRHGYCDYEGVNSLLNTTITNWESILFGINTGSIICNADYLRNLKRRYLDVVCELNPNSLGMCVRIARAFVVSDVEFFSGKAARILRDGLLNHSFEQISSYEKTHYRASYVDRATYDHLFTFTDSSNSDSADIRVSPVERSIPLFIDGCDG